MCVLRLLKLPQQGVSLQESPYQPVQVPGWTPAWTPAIQKDSVLGSVALSAQSSCLGCLQSNNYLKFEFKFKFLPPPPQNAAGP